MNDLIIVNQTNEQLFYDELRWYQKREIVVIFLIFLFPPLGLYWIFKGVYKKGKNNTAIKVGVITKLYATSYCLFFVSIFIGDVFVILAFTNLIIGTPLFHLLILNRQRRNKTEKDKSEKLKGLVASYLSKKDLPLTKWYKNQTDYKSTELIPIRVLHKRYLKEYGDVYKGLVYEGNEEIIDYDLKFLDSNKLNAFVKLLEQERKEELEIEKLFEESDETVQDSNWVERNKGKVATGVAVASLFAGYKMARKKK